MEYTKVKVHRSMPRFLQSGLAVLFTIIVTLAAALPEGCNAQPSRFSYRAIPREYLKRQHVDSFKQRVSGLEQTSKNLEELLPHGYVKDGTVDYTRYLQAGLDTYRNVIFPPFPVLISTQGLRVGSGSTLVFKQGAKLLMQPNNLERYDMIKVFDASDVEIYNPVLVGDRKQHTGTTGEWGTGISIRSSSNVTVVHPVISDCWGDGMGIGQSSIKSPVSENISIYDAVLDNNRRNGISIASVNGLRLINPVAANSNGTLPMVGIHIEPNGNYNTVQHVEISDAVTFNNANTGIAINILTLAGKADQQCDISINNHLDDSSRIGFYFSGVRKPKEGTRVKGLIHVNQAAWNNNRWPFDVGRSFDYSPGLTLRCISVNNMTLKDAASRPENGQLRNLLKRVQTESKIKLDDYLLISKQNIYGRFKKNDLSTNAKFVAKLYGYALQLSGVPETPRWKI